MIRVNPQHRFWVGVGLFAFQASQSLDRALAESNLEGLREFYLNKSSAILIAEHILKRSSGRVFGRWHWLRRKSIEIEDLYILAQLLIDFESVLGNENQSNTHLGCLRFCMAAMSMRLLDAFGLLGSHEMTHLNWHNKSGEPNGFVSVEEVVGKDWLQS